MYMMDLLWQNLVSGAIEVRKASAKRERDLDNDIAIRTKVFQEDEHKPCVFYG